MIKPDDVRGVLVRLLLLSPDSTIRNTDSLLQAGALDSVGIIELVAALEEQFGIAVSEEDLVPEHFDSITAITRFVQERST